MPSSLSADQKAKLDDHFKRRDNQDGPGTIVGAGMNGATPYNATIVLDEGHAEFQMNTARSHGLQFTSPAKLMHTIPKKASHCLWLTRS